MAGPVKPVTPTATEILVGVERMVMYPIEVNGGNTVRARFSFDENVRITGITVMSATVATVGAYTLQAVRTADAKNLLSAASFDLTGLAAATWTDMTLSATPADLELNANADAYVDFISDNAGLDATGVYLRVTAVVI